MYEFQCIICDNKFLIKKYGDGYCPVCETQYDYNEGHGIELSHLQIEILKKHGRENTMSEQFNEYAKKDETEEETHGAEMG